MTKLNIQQEFQVERVSFPVELPITRIRYEAMPTGHDGESTKRVMRMEHGTRVSTDGYMIYYPQGHSNYVPADDVDQLRRIGVFRDPRLVDMETGEEVPEGFGMTPKEIVARKERNRPRAPGQVGGLTQLEEMN